MNILIGIALFILVLVCFSPSSKVNVVCSGYDTVISVVKGVAQTSTEMHVNVNRTTSVVTLPKNFNQWQSNISLGCQEKMRRIFAFTGNLEPSRYQQAIQRKED